MKKLILLSFLTLGIVVPRQSDAQSRYPKNYFRSPIDFPLTLAGGFGDVRKNHFHSGIDIRTGGEEGKPVYAIADGYVSRINISSTGFGKAIYITHPNGYVSVYGHLKKLNGAIGTWMRDQQYRKETFELDIPVDPGVLKVKKGDVIAFSGNTGLSEGPHLHFEMRDAATQEIIDPMLFGLPFRDITPPRIYNVRIYPFDGASQVNYTGSPVTLAVTGAGNDCHVNAKDTVTVSGNIIFGIQALDFGSDTGSRDGITSIELFVDTLCCFSQKIERFAFAETRYANSELDYPQLEKNGQRIMRSYIAPNNKLSMYGRGANRGVVRFLDSRAHKVIYVVKDAFGNATRLTFWVKSNAVAPMGIAGIKTPKGTLLTCGKSNSFTADGIVFDLPADALYEDLDFIYSTSASVHGSFSVVHHLHNDFVPIHSACTLSISTAGVPKNLIGKALIVKVNDNGHFSGKSSRLENTFLKAQIKEFGDYTVALDTTPPVIRPGNVGPNKNVGKQQNLSLRISDNLSGIQSYRGTLNGKWILMDFDAKSSQLVYTFDDRIRPGKNSFRLAVRDAVGNETVYQATLTR
ncbi:MAG: M23 family metallopeptidase [Bacteroidetes bacterium]|nr:M23 family metallopeptidase [Bacteroidota bacterium]